MVRCLSVCQTDVLFRNNRAHHHCICSIETLVYGVRTPSIWNIIVRIPHRVRCDLRCHKSMRLYLIIVQDRDKVSTVSNGTNCKLIVSAIHRYYFQWPWATPNPDFPWHSRAYALSLRAGTVFNWLRHVKKCLCHRLGNIQCGFRSSSWGSTYPQAQSIQPNCWSDMPTPAVQPNLRLRVRPAQPSTESFLTSTSATLLAAQTSSSNSTDYCKQASLRSVLLVRIYMHLISKNI